MSESSVVGAGLARESDGVHFQANRNEAFAGKPRSNRMTNCNRCICFYITNTPKSYAIALHRIIPINPAAMFYRDAAKKPKPSRTAIPGP
jgi:hypothetical protein